MNRYRWERKRRERLLMLDPRDPDYPDDQDEGGIDIGDEEGGPWDGVPDEYAAEEAQNRYEADIDARASQ